MAGTANLASDDAVQCCTLCDKPFTNASSYARHVSYCRRAQSRPKKRQKSCRACGQAKAKCSFETPCSRCTLRNIDCVYDHKHARSNESRLIEVTGLPASLATTIPSFDNSTNAVALATNFPWFDASSIQSTSTPEQSQASAGPSNPLTFSSLLATIQNNSLGDPLIDMMLATHTDIGTLARYRAGDAVAERSSLLIMQTLRTFPEKMQNSDNLPFFIHPYCYQTARQEPLAVCARLCQVFCGRTPDIYGFIWRCIRTEQLRYLDENLTKYELLAACQAQVIYIMMFVIEEGMRHREWVQELLMLSGAVCERMSMLCDDSEGKFCHDEKQHPSKTWDEWIFAESRRRTACVWFLMSIVFSVQTGVRCSTMEDFRVLPLPAPRLQWEAKDPLSWQRRFGLPEIDDLDTVGGLIDVHGMSEEPVFARRLDSWNAKTDQLGLLLNLAVDML